MRAAAQASTAPVSLMADMLPPDPMMAGLVVAQEKHCV